MHIYVQLQHKFNVQSLPYVDLFIYSPIYWQIDNTDINIESIHSMIFTNPVSRSVYTWECIFKPTSLLERYHDNPKVHSL